MWGNTGYRKSGGAHRLRPGAPQGFQSDGPKRCVGAQEDWKRIRDRWERRDPLDIAGYVEAGSLVETTS
jgi:hypothetical protein